MLKPRPGNTRAENQQTQSARRRSGDQSWWASSQGWDRTMLHTWRDHTEASQNHSLEVGISKHRDGSRNFYMVNRTRTQLLNSGRY